MFAGLPYFHKILLKLTAWMSHLSYHQIISEPRLQESCGFLLFSLSDPFVSQLSIFDDVLEEVLSHFERKWYVSPPNRFRSVSRLIVLS